MTIEPLQKSLRSTKSPTRRGIADEIACLFWPLAFRNVNIRLRSTRTVSMWFVLFTLFTSKVEAGRAGSGPSLVTGSFTIIASL